MTYSLLNPPKSGTARKLYDELAKDYTVISLTYERAGDRWRVKIKKLEVDGVLDLFCGLSPDGSVYFEKLDHPGLRVIVRVAHPWGGFTAPRLSTLP